VGDIISATGGTPWDPEEDAGRLQPVGLSGLYELNIGKVPAGTYEFKVRLARAGTVLADGIVVVGGQGLGVSFMRVNSSPLLLPHNTQTLSPPPYTSPFVSPSPPSSIYKPAFHLQSSYFVTLAPVKSTRFPRRQVSEFHDAFMILHPLACKVLIFI